MGDGFRKDEMLRAAADGAAGLIVMSTEGHRDFLDALRGSTTERIVSATCLVLAVPADAVQPQESIVNGLATGRLVTSLT